jgi:diguanylate cyclase (GGDEF)-like protein
VHVFRFTADFVQYLVGVKLLLMTGGFLYGHLASAQAHQPLPGWFWAVGLVLVVANASLYAFWEGGDNRQIMILWASFALDVCTVVFLFTVPPAQTLGLLIGLGLITGLYGLLLPYQGGVIAGLTCLLIYGAAVVIGVTREDDPARMSSEALSLLTLGLPVLGGAFAMTRRMRRSLEGLYGTTDGLTLDLTRQAVDAELANEELLERNREVNTLLQIVENFVTALDFEDLFQRVVEAFRLRFNFDKFSLFLHNPEEEVLELRVEAGGEVATGIAKAVKPGEGIVGWCYKHSQGVLISDVRKDERFKEFNPRNRRLRSLACQPVVYRGETLGVLCLDSEKPGSFDNSTYEFLERVTPLIAISVNNSLNYSEAKAQSRTDNLTSLSNHRGFIEHVVPMLEDAYTTSLTLVLIMIDIDHFKQINDTYGHMVGNQILTELADILRRFFRGSDLVARFGGEEFAVVLNGTRPEIAPRIAEQLRRKVESHQFPISLARDEFKQVTISLGLSSTRDGNLLPDIARGSRESGSDTDVYLRNAEELLERMIENADQALYASKREGRNQVMLSFDYPVAPPEETVVNLEKANQPSEP